MNKLIMITALLLFGGFYNWNVAFLGCFICLHSMMLYHGKKNIYKKERRLLLWIPEIIVVFQVLVFFWSVDRSAHIAAIMRGVSILLWMNVCFQEKCSSNDKLLFMIPQMGEIMVLIGCMTACFEKVKPLFWRAGRFGGFFQYANTCALFLLLGIVISYVRSDENKRCMAAYIRKLVQTAVLILGLLLTGSRGIFILGVLWGILHGIKDKKFRRVFISVILSIGIAIGMYYMLTGRGTQNISRIFTMLKYNSTFYGRILYDLDGISILRKHPMGLGYMGYYYVQHMMQTGVYTVRFVHNDILQLGLDCGIIPVFLFAGYMTWQFKNGGQSLWKKEVLVIILTASVIDFHMQYIIVDFIVVLCLDLGSQSIRQKRAEKLENSILFGVLMSVFVFLLIPYMAVYGKRYDIAVQFMPRNTEALQSVMLAADDKDVAVSYADKILQGNRYVADAYNIKAYAAAMENDIESVIRNQDAALKLEKYDADRYYSYDLLLEQLVHQCEEAGQYQKAGQIETKRRERKEQLERLREQTNPIAYKLRDKPKYVWKENEK